MNQELMNMAVKAGIEFTNDPTETPMTTFAECWIEELEAFAALVAAAEREACAKVCVAVAERNIWWDINEIEAAVECAAAIRERGETE